MSHLLIYDADLSGHHRDYLDAVVNYLQSHTQLSPSISRVSLVLPTDYWQSREDCVMPQHVRRQDIDPQGLVQRNKAKPRQRARLELEMLIDMVNRQHVDELILMNMDYFQVALASPLAGQLNCSVSGIQLQPYTRSELVARQPPFSIGLWLRALRKRFRLNSMTKRIRLERVCIPADTAAVQLMNRRHGKKLKAVMLPEPYLSVTHAIEADPADELPDIFARYSLTSTSRIVLVFGSISNRKNVENIIRAMDQLHASGPCDVVLLVVGKANSAYQTKLRQLATRDNVMKSYIRFDFEFVPDTVLEAVFRACAIVAMPYFKTWQSSGILFQAIRYEKPVVAANKGLVSDLVRQYKLGETVDPAMPQHICNAITTLLHSWTPSSASKELTDCHTADNHAAVLLNQNR